MDLLVKLYDLPEFTAKCPDNIYVRPAMVPERHLVVDFVREHFSEYWVSEVEFALSQHPVRCLIATRNSQIVGFACYDTTFKGYFGPTGVSQTERGLGIGEALLHRSMHLMHLQGYQYAMIGSAGPIEFYKRSVNATEIVGSTPGAYQNLLRKNVI
ncbi:GNAT family N-acetyltransferase [Vibrio sp. DW001]|uniref:GNAT family N-acetyltransferase n=1 Tax=Vibrio sp. DW001 TaxID=2912315 RepID=UPI0023AF4A96|nr:GNAT family N-acetyltransferase [Vibrio sp. DW001]WED27837.1 GNAT family N-acetyltransferase [Vibrio sp. DW001]